MVLRGLLREWRERRDGTLEGPALSTDEADMDSATVNSREIYVQPTEPSNPSQGDVWIDTSGVE